MIFTKPSTSGSIRVDPDHLGPPTPRLVDRRPAAAWAVAMTSSPGSALSHALASTEKPIASSQIKTRHRSSLLRGTMGQHARLGGSQNGPGAPIGWSDRSQNTRFEPWGSWSVRTPSAQ